MSEKADYKVIRKSSLGSDLDDYESKVLAGLMTVSHLKDSETLVTEGEGNYALYLLADGKLTVQSKIDGKDVTVYTMKVGECAGTRAFVDRSSRKATLRAEGPVTIYALDPTDFESILAAHPRIVYNVMRALFRITHANLMRMNLETEQMAKYIQKSGGRF